MIKFIWENEQFVFKIGHVKVKHEFVISLEDTQALANELSSDIQSQIINQEYSWQSGSWKIYRLTLPQERPRDLKRKRVRVHYKTYSWALTSSELDYLLDDCQVALKQSAL